MRNNLNSPKTKSSTTSSLAASGDSARKPSVAATAANSYDSLMHFKDRGTDILDEVRHLASEAAELIPDGVKEQISDTQKQLVEKMKQRPGATAAAAAAVAGVCAAVVANRLLKPARRSSAANSGSNKGNRS